MMETLRSTLPIRLNQLFKDCRIFPFKNLFIVAPNLINHDIDNLILPLPNHNVNVIKFSIPIANANPILSIFETVRIPPQPKC